MRAALNVTALAIYDLFGGAGPFRHSASSLATRWPHRTSEVEPPTQRERDRKSNRLVHSCVDV